MAEIEIKLSARRLFVVLVFAVTGACTMNNLVFADSCETAYKRIQPTLFTAEDNKEYQIINFPNFIQEAVAIGCAGNRSCEKGTCQQDYKLHQFMSVPADKQKFELSELQFRLFKVPYGCKCSA